MKSSQSLIQSIPNRKLFIAISLVIVAYLPHCQFVLIILGKDRFRVLAFLKDLLVDCLSSDSGCRSFSVSSLNRIGWNFVERDLDPFASWSRALDGS